jgi:hypothetical protein
MTQFVNPACRILSVIRVQGGSLLKVISQGGRANRKPERQVHDFGVSASPAGTTIAPASHGSSSSTVRYRNLFCSEQLKDAELNAENGREDGGPAFHSKQCHKGGQAGVTSIEVVKQRR